MYSEMLDAVVGMVQDVSPLPVFKGPMPQPESVSFAIATGAPYATTFCRTTHETVSVVVNAKSESMQKAREALDKIHHFLTRAEKYPQTDTMEITAIKTNSVPSDAGRDGKHWLFVSSISVQVNFE